MVTGNEIAYTLHEVVDRDLTFMHICGTHEAAIARSGPPTVPDTISKIRLQHRARTED
jgi:hydrogenase maturation factor